MIRKELDKVFAMVLETEQVVVLNDNLLEFPLQVIVRLFQSGVEWVLQFQYAGIFVTDS